MITFSKLGCYGRLGNQLFELAACLGLADITGSDVIIPPWEHSHVFHDPPRSWTIAPDLSKLQVYHEHGFRYQTIPPIYDIDLRGFFQSYLYFERIKGDIRRRFRPVAKGFTRPYTCCLHVRRGDYVGHPCHPVASREYYREAMIRMRARGIRLFEVFSDDLKWCEQYVTGRDVELVDIAEPGLALARMSECQSFIIANSTFSWWAAYLGEHPEKHVIYPSVWFAGDYACYDTRDLCPPDWEKI